MKILEYATREEQCPGVMYDGKLLNLSLLLKVFFLVKHGINMPDYGNVRDMLRSGILSVAVLKDILKWVGSAGLEKDFEVNAKYKLKAPLIPGKIVALGRNYAAHAREQNAPVPDEPIIFEKSISSIIGPDDNVIYWNIIKKLHSKTHRVDHEVELAVIMGKRAKKVSASRAMDHIFGYTILNDVTARTIQADDFKKSHPWFRSKSMDTFCPLGPWIVTKDEINNPHSLDLELKVNGKTRQKDNTRTMIFKLPKIIEYISGYMTLEPGDIISTGTPDGISPLKPGDVMEAKIEKIGVLRNRIVKE